MNKLANKPITEKDLRVFTKEELIYCILNSGFLFDPPVRIFYERRMDNNFKKNKERGKKVKKLLDEIDKQKDLKGKYKMMLKIDSLSKTCDKLRKENDKVMEILYGDIWS